MLSLLYNSRINYYKKQGENGNEEAKKRAEKMESSSFGTFLKDYRWYFNYTIFALSTVIIASFVGEEWYGVGYRPVIVRPMLFIYISLAAFYFVWRIKPETTKRKRIRIAALVLIALWGIGSTAPWIDPNTREDFIKEAMVKAKEEKEKAANRRAMEMEAARWKEYSESMWEYEKAKRGIE